MSREHSGRVAHWTAAAVIIGAATAYAICAATGLRVQSMVRQISGDLLINLVVLSALAAVAVAVATGIRQRRAALAQVLRKTLGRLVYGTIAVGTILTLWWPELTTLWLVIPSVFGLAGLTVGRVAVAHFGSAVIGNVAAGGIALLFAFMSSDVLGLGEYGVAPVFYAIVVGTMTGLLTRSSLFLLRSKGSVSRG